MASIKTLYHGSAEIIRSPEFGKGNKRNDYGLGFYCTESLDLAKEWACGDRRGGFANTYTIDTSALVILNLSNPQYGILDWLALLVNNRIFSINSPIAEEAKGYLTRGFLPDISIYDAVAGYRADDSYFSFAMDFLNNTISLRQLSRAMRLGSLGEQFMLKSKKAFGMLQFACSEPVDGLVYYAKRMARDRDAREEYRRQGRKPLRSSEELFMIDIIRNEMKQDDERLQRSLFA